MQSPRSLRSVLIAGVMCSLPARAAVSGADLFLENCASCHGRDGHARTPAGRKLHAKDLTKSALTETEIAAQILNGTKDRRGVERMPSFRDKFDTTQLAALAKHVRELRR